jgi:Sulfotransferase domain
LARRLPDFFIVGAPKCGTTALYHYLSMHPRIYMPTLKEPHFFCRDFANFGKIHDLDAYLDLFKNASDDALIGEASVWYLYSSCAISRIMEANPEARIIAMLRNPVAMAKSLHRQLILSLREDIENFEAAWRAQHDRRLGKRLPLYCPEQSHLQYADVCRYSHQIERMLEAVPKDQLKVLIFEEFFDDIRAQYDSVTEFLGVESDGRTIFPPINVAREPKSNWLWELIRRPPFPLVLLHKPAQSLSRMLGIRPIKLLNDLDSRAARKAPSLSPAFEHELYEFFAGDIAALERLLGRPLPAWKAAAIGPVGQTADEISTLCHSRPNPCH